MIFRDVKMHSMVFVGGLLIIKTGYNEGRMPVCGSRVLLNPNSKCEEVESLSATGMEGSKFIKQGEHDV